VSSRSILQPGADIDDRACRPLATARRRKPAIIEGLGDSVGALANELGQDFAELLRPRVSLLTAIVAEIDDIDRLDLVQNSAFKLAED
jgi:hypothetical protein